MCTSLRLAVPVVSLAVGLVATQCSRGPELSGVTVVVTNPAPIGRSDELVMIPLDQIVAQWPGVRVEHVRVHDADAVIPSELIDANGDGKVDVLACLADFRPGETRTLAVEEAQTTERPAPGVKRTQAMLAVKQDYELVDGLYTGGRFVAVKEASIPEGHFAHDAYFKFEGPGWESDRVAYRMYLDSRNRIDIFGKKVARMVLQDVGTEDLVSDHRESYTRESDWGLDMFRVGESFGVGSFALWESGIPAFVADVEKVDCRVTADGALYSALELTYRGWKVGASKHTLTADLSIAAGSRLTRVDLTLAGESAVWSTGLAKHPAAESLSDPGVREGAWGYRALFGAQSLIGDTLGIAVFYRPEDFVMMVEESMSDIVVLRPEGTTLTYYLAAAWGKEPGGITSREGFSTYLKETAQRLGSPVTIGVIKEEH